MRTLLAMAIAVFALAAACGDSTDSPGPPSASPGATPTAGPTPPEGLVRLELTGEDGAGATVDVELVRTPEERRVGLMFRESLPEDRGMLFLFPGDHSTGFWMLDTPLPLDIAYIAADGTVLEVNEGVPFNTTIIQPQGPYRYTLEVNQGWFERHGLGPKAVVTIPEGLPPAE
ncbi:MAG: DUF192 domain-containing protein [Dehalococcoidia bacterium]